MKNLVTWAILTTIVTLVSWFLISAVMKYMVDAKNAQG
jgi:hypothetical protein